MKKISASTLYTLTAGLFMVLSLQSANAGKESIKVLMLGGDRHHDYELCYGKLDKAVLEADGFANVIYTEDIAEAAKQLSSCDVFMACGNVPYDDTLKKAIVDFLDRKGGMFLLHAAVWTRKGWPFLNTKIVGGTPRGHEPRGLTFDVKNIKPKHPVMKDVPEQFEIIDELYRMEHHQKEIKWQVLCVSTSRETNETYPAIFIPKNGKWRVVCCSLGHDELAHNVPAYQQFVKNAVAWLVRDQQGQ